MSRFFFKKRMVLRKCKSLAQLVKEPAFYFQDEVNVKIDEVRGSRKAPPFGMRSNCVM